MVSAVDTLSGLKYSHISVANTLSAPKYSDIFAVDTLSDLKYSDLSADYKHHGYPEILTIIEIQYTPMYYLASFCVVCFVLFCSRLFISIFFESQKKRRELSSPVRNSNYGTGKDGPPSVP